jgi:Rhodopirellula transposase DDE domain
MRPRNAYWLRLLPTLPETQRRWLAGVKALELGRGGLTSVQRATGLSVNTVAKGIREVERGLPTVAPERLRKPGGGRKPVEETDPALLNELRRLVEGTTAGSPMRALIWTHKSTRTLSAEMSRQGHVASPNTVARLLEVLGYSLQVNSKSKEGRSPPERDAQFRYINGQVEKFQAEGNPVLSVDTKKKERVGNFKNAGKTYRPKGEPYEVNMYDFPTLGKGVAIPYGTYDIGRNRGFVNVGMTHDTAEFAVESLTWWWKKYGRRHYPEATGWLVCADGGGSNGTRNRAWKVHLHELTKELGIPVTVCHYPPGTSKWNKIEHRMFSFISMNWQGTPLESYATVVNLIAGTKNKDGLKISARLDQKVYEKGVKIDDEILARVPVKVHKTNPKWNYSILPQ